MEDRPSGAVAKRHQGAKTISTEGQSRICAGKWIREIAKKINERNMKCNLIWNIIEQNKAIEVELRAKVWSLLLKDDTIEHFLLLEANTLKYFIHAWKLTGKTFQRNKTILVGKKLNKTIHQTETARETERACSGENLCLIWRAWHLWNEMIILNFSEAPGIVVTQMLGLLR